MEVLLALIVIVAIAGALFMWRDGNTAPQSTARSHVSIASEPAPFKTNRDWIANRWRAAEKAHEARDYSLFPPWYFEPATERQLARLEREGVKQITLTKGQASDLIGLSEPPDDADARVLKFFGAPVAQNQTMARAQARELLAQASNLERWNARSATPEQKSDIRFLGGKVAKGLIATDAERMLHELRNANPDKSDDLDNLNSILDEFEDADFREAVGMKKPSRAVIQEAVDALLAGGSSLDDLAGDPDAVADKVLELHPELERQDL